MDTITSFRTALQANPGISAKQLAELLGVTRSRVYQLAKNEGMVLARPLYPHMPREPYRGANRFGGDAILSCHYVGGISELVVCADLLRRGFPVYRAVTFHSAADLVTDIRGRLIRVEVRSATRDNDGFLRFARPTDASRYDLLAAVEPDNIVSYFPEGLVA